MRFKRGGTIGSAGDVQASLRVLGRKWADEVIRKEMTRFLSGGAVRDYRGMRFIYGGLLDFFEGPRHSCDLGDFLELW